MKTTTQHMLLSSIGIVEQHYEDNDTAYVIVYAARKASRMQLALVIVETLAPSSLVLYTYTRTSFDGITVVLNIAIDSL